MTYGNAFWKEIEEDLRRMYFEDFLSLDDIAKRFNVVGSTVSAQFKKLGIETRKERSELRYNAKYSMNIHYFDNIDCEQKAYILGLIASDGHVSKNGVLMFSFQLRDADILNEIRSNLEGNHPIGTKHNGTSLTLNMTSKYLCDKLNSMGINNNKSYGYDFNKLISSVPWRLVPHFVRGLFDGDGSIAIRKYPYQKKHTYKLGFTQTLTPCMFVRDYFQLNTKMVDEGNGIWTCVSSDHKKIIEAGNTMYGDATIFMERKRNTFADIEHICKREHGAIV